MPACSPRTEHSVPDERAPRAERALRTGGTSAVEQEASTSTPYDLPLCAGLADFGRLTKRPAAGGRRVSSILQGKPQVWKGRSEGEV